MVHRQILISAVIVSMSFWSDGLQATDDGPLSLYFIDVEGGAATLIVTPTGESVLIDSGYPDNQRRDLDRILQVARDEAGLKQIDHAVVSHWHLDHYGNHAALEAEFGIETFWDRGIPDSLTEDPEYPNRIAAYRGASQNASRPLRAGDALPLKSGQTPLSVQVLTSGREVVQNEGEMNPFSDRHQPQPVDSSDNSASLSLLFQFGAFRFLTCGDLTWNTEAKLVTPKNPVGKVDLFMVTHHGLPVSNNPAMVLAIDPIVAVMCNGPKKGGAEQTMKTLREVQSLKDWFQLHRNVDLDPALQARPECIANSGITADCKGQWIRAVVAPDGNSYTVQIGPNGKLHKYSVRTATR
jgi:competence protein ComEC